MSSTSSTSKTCTACRTRKVRCDGVMPNCGPCSRARKPLDCSYATAPTAVRSRASWLEKGAACYACRRKKKKCDAKKPSCTTCQIAGKALDCNYVEGDQKKCVPSKNELELRMAFHEKQIDRHNARQSTKGKERDTLIETNLHNFLHSASSSRPNMLDTPPAISAHLSANHGPFSGLPPSLTPPLSLHVLSGFVPLVLQDPDLAVDAPPSIQEIVQYRATFLAHFAQLGHYLRAHKIKAILAGDFSGTAVHPSLVYTGQLLGCIMLRPPSSVARTTAFERVQLELLLRLLVEPPDTITAVQIQCLLAVYFLIKGRLDEGTARLQMGARLLAPIIQNSGTWSPNHILGPVGMSHMYEQIGAISELLYLDKAAHITINISLALGGEYEDMSNVLAWTYPCLAANNIVVLRARSITYLQKVRQLITAGWGNATLAGNSVADTSSLCELSWDFLREISHHVNAINDISLRSTSAAHDRYKLNLKTCMVVSMTAIVELHRAMSKLYPESKQKARDVMYDIIPIMTGFREADYVVLDPIAGVCLTTAASVLLEELAEKQATHHMDSRWHTAMCVVERSARKLADRLPYMENTSQMIQSVRKAAANMQDIYLQP